MLKSIEISGFKSFAKKGELEFTTPISAIVGPNGSGKSNIAEAFRFVLGEQSLKSMRGKRGEDLIFSGSKSERSMNRASVKIVFDNSKRFLDIDYDEVMIERIVHRDGANQYFINGSAVRLKDIIELLVGANIGASGHHIISQGESDKILSVNQKERRGMIEEALGLKIYQYKIAESEKKLNKTEENITSVQSLRREISPHLKFLNKQVKKIEESVEMREELKVLYKEYFKREDEYLKERKNYIQTNRKPLALEMEELDRSLVEAKEILTKESQDGESEEVLKLESKLQDIRNKKSELSRKLGQIEGMHSFEERRLDKEKERQNSHDEAEVGRMIKFSDVKDFTNEIDSNLEKYEGWDLIKKVREIISEFILRNKTQKVEIEIDESELVRLKKEKQDLGENISLVDKEEKEIEQKYEQLKKSIESEKDFSRKAELKVFEISAKQSEIRSQLNSLIELENRINIEDENFKRELNEAFVLAGRDSIQFYDFEITDDNTDRSAQDERRRKTEKIKIKLEDMGAGSSEDVMREFKEVKERDEFLEREIEDLEATSSSLKELIDELKDTLDAEFKQGITKINEQFQEFFTSMFGGGRASLSLEKPKKRRKKSVLEGLEEMDMEDMEDDEEEKKEMEGIEVNVSLPNKKTKGLQMLSGGERSLTSIALLFAMSQINPPPFIILDETDAALDEANSRRYGDMIENLSHYSQLILITHNRETMSRAGVLYGITMGLDGVSRLLSVKLEEAVKVAK